MRRLAFLPCLLAIATHAADPVRVACLGDSITAGAKATAATESYPAQLQQMLGAGFVVKNFGIGGATMWHGGKPNAFQQLPGATAFGPQIAIVMFGINDTRSRDVNYWGHFSQFDADATRMIETLLALPSQPRVLLCLPTANFAHLPGMPDERKANVAERLPRLVEVRARIANIANRYADRGVGLVDLNAATEKRPDVFDVDGVHLNAAGYKLLAEKLRPHIEASARKFPAPVR